jgi:hydrogenase expression/formation protein HypE
MRKLIASVFARGRSDDPPDRIGLGAMDDGGAVRLGDRWLVMTTDSHVVQPIFFPGGDIGRLAICGTVNDLAMMGATEVLGLTCAVVIEEGFDLSLLCRLQDSIERACAEADAEVLAGDTKVMGRGELDGIVLNTTGFALAEAPVRDAGLRPGDDIVITGTVADHGMAVMALRHELDLGAELRSDVAPLNGLVREALAAGGRSIVAMKDPTRGGVASALHEMATKSGVGILLSEAQVPLRPEVKAAAEIFGVDPLQVANEGKALLGVRPEATEAVLDRLRGHPLGKEARWIGRCHADHVGSVVVDTGFGRRLLAEADGELLPRIC